MTKLAGKTLQIKAKNLFNNPDGKKGENNYLRYLTHKGAKARYKKISKSLSD